MLPMVVYDTLRCLPNCKSVSWTQTTDTVLTLELKKLPLLGLIFTFFKIFFLEKLRKTHFTHLKWRGMDIFSLKINFESGNIDR